MQMQYFDLKEFDCQETGTNEMNPFFLEKLDYLRHKCGFPFKITSGYRDPSHSIEARKTRPGTHTRGIAADIQINSGSEGYVIVREAMKMGLGGIGIAKNFIHVDMRDTVQVIWTY
jgi:uncharacterized protein YcbK (DUF882 family)